MKKQKPKPSPEQLAKIEAAKRAADLEACFVQCRKIGRSVRFSFLRIISKALDCEEPEAIAEFDRAVQSGKILQDGTNAAGDVEIYFAK